MAELFDIILGDMRSSRKNVNRLLSLGILFSLIGHFYVVEPFFHYEAQKRALWALHAKIKAVRVTLEDIQKRIKAYPAHLKEVQEKMYFALLSPSSGSFKVGEIDLPANVEFEEAVGLYVEKWFPNLIGKLKKPVDALVLELEGSEEGTDYSNLLSKADKAVTNFRAGLEKLEKGTPDIWRDYTGPKAKMATDLLQKLVEDSFEPIRKEIPGLEKMTKAKLERIIKEIEEELEPRIKTLLSQLGPVPVSLADFIILFPLVIVALVVMVTVALHRSGRLYIALWRVFTKDVKAVDRGAFQQFTDCWYLPPYPTVIQPLLLIALLVAGTGMFVRASLIIILTGEPALFTLLSAAGDSSTQSVFTGAYIVGTLMIIGCLWFILKTLRRISQEAIG